MAYDNFDKVYDGIWQGSAPPTGNDLREIGFTTLVLCAEEYQPHPPDLAFPGVEVIYAPNDDTFESISEEQLRGALSAARKVASAALRGAKVLVTCQAGKNRSGLVSTLAIHLLTGAAGWRCVWQVKNNRTVALTNPTFTMVLERLQQRTVAPVG